MDQERARLGATPSDESGIPYKSFILCFLCDLLFNHLPFKGKTPFEHMQSQRMDRARHLLASSALTVKEVSARTGYEDAAYFSRVFTKRFGITPSNYQSSPLWHGR